MTTRDTVIAYLRAIEAHDLDAVAALLHDEVEQIEYPNKLSPQTRRFDKAGMRAAGERGAAILASERYEIGQLIVEGERAAVTLVWSATLKDGRTMSGNFCSVIELRDGKVWRQAQYDCFNA
jgi:ketosteroid isomerase-like protein